MTGTAHGLTVRAPDGRLLAVAPGPPSRVTPSRLTPSRGRPAIPPVLPADMPLERPVAA